MINGAHFLLDSTDPASDQETLERILGTRTVPAEGDRLILAMPAAEIATHEGSGEFAQPHAGRSLLGSILYLMCDDLGSTVELLRDHGLRCTKVEASEFGLKTTLVLPSGGEIGLHRPSHATALGPW